MPSLTLLPHIHINWTNDSASEIAWLSFQHVYVVVKAKYLTMWPGPLCSLENISSNFTHMLHKHVPKQVTLKIFSKLHKGPGHNVEGCGCYHNPNMKTCWKENLAISSQVKSHWFNLCECVEARLITWNSLENSATVFRSLYTYKPVH